MNKVNLCWVISDGRKGHEIQSTTLAAYLAKSTIIHRFNLNNPWAMAAPKILPGFKYGINWQEPDCINAPDVIIATGRKAAAVAKYMKNRLKRHNQPTKHIQILNPADSHNNYDILLVPEHDGLAGSNVISFIGSIHPFGPTWHTKCKQQRTEQVAVILGNPIETYLKQDFIDEIRLIRQLYNNHSLFFCGSPRLTSRAIKLIQQQVKTGDERWFDEHDGENPYPSLLRSAAHLFVSTDSINMMNECAATAVPVTLLAKMHTPTKKHQRYIDSTAERWSDFEYVRHPTSPSPHAVDQIINDKRFQKLWNSPISSKSG